MSSPPVSTEWPPFMPTPVKELIARFFAVVDDTNPRAGDILADEIFTSDGDAYFGSKLFHGSQRQLLYIVLQRYEI
jgi:hypothetical protein